MPAGSETGPDVSVSAIVVNYNTAGVLADCVTTLRVAVESGRMAYEAKLAVRSSQAVASSPLTAFLD